MNAVASGRKHKTWAKQFCLAEGPATQGIPAVSCQQSTFLTAGNVRNKRGLWEPHHSPPLQLTPVCSEPPFKISSPSWERLLPESGLSLFLYTFTSTKFMETSQPSPLQLLPGAVTCSLSPSASHRFSHPWLALQLTQVALAVG